MTRQAFLVEDSPDVRKLLESALLDRANTEVIAHSETEQQAIGWLKVNADICHFVVVDLFLKQGTGLGVLADCAGLCNAGQQIVVFTNHATPDTRARCLRLGAHAVFDKASELTEFVDYCAAADVGILRP